jgi:hypothetical protein
MVGVNNGTLSDTTKAAITKIFGAAGVDIKFVDGQQGDVQANLFANLAAVNAYGQYVPGTNEVLLDNVRLMSLAIGSPFFQPNQGDWGLGVIFSHEIGHYMVHCAHSSSYGSFSDCGVTGLMRPGNMWDHQMDQFKPFSRDQQFTPQQAAALRAFCSLHPGPGKKSSSGGGSEGSNQPPTVTYSNDDHLLQLLLQWTAPPPMLFVDIPFETGLIEVVTCTIHC